MTPKFPHLHKSEHAPDHRNPAKRRHDSPAQDDRAEKDDRSLGYWAQRDREQHELKPDDDGIVNEIHAVGTGAEAVEDRSVRDGEPAEDCDEGKADCAAAQYEGEVTQKLQGDRQGPMSASYRQDECYDDDEP